jgi:hypothetical protein
MGAHVVFSIEFKTLESRKLFDKKFTIKKSQVLCEEGTVVVYFMGYMDYQKPYEILRSCSKAKNGIEITYFSWISICDRNSRWDEIRKNGSKLRL